MSRNFTVLRAGLANLSFARSKPGSRHRHVVVLLRFFFFGSSFFAVRPSSHRMRRLGRGLGGRITTWRCRLGHIGNTPGRREAPHGVGIDRFRTAEDRRIHVVAEVGEELARSSSAGCRSNEPP